MMSLPKIKVGGAGKMDDNDTRHCAFCLKTLHGKEIKKCTKCHRRAYCSKDCQIGDWCIAPTNPTEQRRGHGHKNWCGIGYGEEDLDWKIVPIDGKGLGVVAMRKFNPLERIMVEGWQLNLNKHAAVQDFLPKNGTLMDKFDFNSVGRDNKDDTSRVLCLRMARLNHSCKPNANYLSVDDFKVMVLFAERTIFPGDEILMCYTSWNDMGSKMDIAVHQGLLESKWNIVCPTNCACLSGIHLGNIQKLRTFDTRIYELTRTNPDGALECVRVVLDNLEKERKAKTPCFSWLFKKRVLFDGFQLAIMKEANLFRARQMISECFEIHSSISHSDAETTLTIKKWMKNPTSHPYSRYLER